MTSKWFNWNSPNNEKDDQEKKQSWNNDKNDGPPDLDEIAQRIQNHFKKMSGGGNNGGNDNDNPNEPNHFFLGLIAFVIIFTIVGIYNSFYIVQPAERGVITRFGALHTTVEPGPHFKLPWIDQHYPVNVDNVNKFVHRAKMLTQDENIADVTVEVQFRIIEPANFLFQDAKPGVTIHNVVESSLREVVGKSKLDEIMTENRGGISEAVKIGSQKLLEDYKSGLLITNINIQDAQPPEQVRDAFADAIKAREDKERLQNQAEAFANDIIPRARGAAAREIESAKAYKAKVVAEATGESQRFAALLNEYQKAPVVTKERLYLETMQDVYSKNGKVIIDSTSNGNLTYLPLDKMLKTPNTQSTEQTPAFGVNSNNYNSNMTPSYNNRQLLNRTRGTR